MVRLISYVEDAIVLSEWHLADLHIIKLDIFTARVHAIGAYGPASQFDHILFLATPVFSLGV